MYLFSKMMAKVKEANMKKMKKTTKSRSFLEKLKVKYAYKLQFSKEL